MDGHRLKLEKVGPTISSFNAMPTKITKNYYVKCSPMKFVWYHLHNPTGAFCVEAKTVINDFSIDCKTVIFFLQISKEMGKAWRKSLMRAKGEPHTPVGRTFSISPLSRSLFSASFQTFCLTAPAYLNMQKYRFSV